MKKILVLIGLIASFASFGQSWDAYYGLLPQADISSRDSVQLLVIDAEKDSTYYILVSQLDLIWSFDSTYLHYRVDSLSTVLVNLDPMVYPTAGIVLSTGSGWSTSITDNSANWNTAFGWGNHATAGYLTEAGEAFDTTYIYIEIEGLRDSMVYKQDSTQLIWGDGITATEGTGTLTVEWDSAAVYSYIDTEVASAGGGLTQPTFTSAEIGTLTDSTISIVWSKNLYAGANAATTDFTVTEDGSAYGISSVSYSDNTISLTGDSIGNFGSTYLIDYDPGTNPVKDSTNLWALAFTDNAVTNNVAEGDVTAPLYVSSEIGTYNDSIILVLLDEALNETAPATTAFTVTEDAVNYGVNAVTINDDSLFIAMDSVGLAGATYLLSYTVPGTNALQDAAGNEVVAWVDSTVTNNLTAGGGGTNMLYNGDFALDSAGWSVYGPIVLDGGVLTYTNGATSGVSQLPEFQVSEMVVSTDYNISFDVSTTGAGLYIYLGNTSNEDFIAATNYTTGSYSLDFTTPGTMVNGIFRLRIWGDADGTIDNIVLTTR